MKIGDLVVLKSGGPLMTVVSLSQLNSESVGVGWFSEDQKEIHYTNLSTSSLSLSEKK